MSNEDGTLWITYNGEIYNHAEIRRELSQSGRHRWKTDHSRHRSHPPRVRGVGHRLPVALPRHVRVRALGRARPRAVARARSHRHQAAVLQRPPRPADVRLRDQGAARGSGAARARSTRRRSSTTCRSSRRPAPQTLFDGIRKLPPGTWLRVGADGAIERAALLGCLGRCARRSTRVGEDEIAERVLAELRTAGQACAR